MTEDFNVIEAKFSERNRKCVIGPLWQYDYGQILIITGIDLPGSYEVHFAHDIRGESIPVIGNADGVQIPDKLLESGSSVFAWLFLHQGLHDGSTEYQVEILVRRRAKPADYQPNTADEKRIVEQLIESKVQLAISETNESVKSNTERIEKLEKNSTMIAYDEDTLSNNNGVLSVRTADNPQKDDPRPITSGAVFDEFSKAVALLKTI